MPLDVPHHDPPSKHRCCLEVATVPSSDPSGEKSFIFALGDDDGAVEQICFSHADALKLLSALATQVRVRWPKGTPYGTGAWLRRRNVLRAEAALQTEQDVQRELEQNKLDLPDVAEFAAEQVQRVQSLLRRRAKVETVLRELRHGQAVLIRAMRDDK